MASKEQKRGNKEVRKPKKTKVAASSPTSSFIVTPGKTPAGGAKKK
ncbi:MAG: hypothetical protein ABI376_02025 [Caulobacteraceae bacterium]